MAALSLLHLGSLKGASEVFVFNHPACLTSEEKGRDAGGCVVYAIGAVYFDVVYLAFEWFFSLPCEFFLGMSLVFGLVFAVLISSPKDMKVWFQGGDCRGCKR